MKQNPAPKTISENRQARFDYEILERYEAGVQLNGQEVKSAKNGRFDLSGGYGIARDGEIWLVNSQIPAYQIKNAGADYDPGRPRRLLLKKNEISALAGKLRQKNLKLIPLRVLLVRNFVKVELAVGRPRKKSDKREVIKKRDLEREMSGNAR